MIGRFLTRWLLSFAVVLSLVYLAYIGSTVFSPHDGTRQVPAQPHLGSVPSTEKDSNPSRLGGSESRVLSEQEAKNIAPGDLAAVTAPQTPLGKPKHVPRNYTRALVVPHTKSEDIAWLYSKELRTDPDLKILPYSVDVDTAIYRVPMNKGREAMAYLTYIIDHYNASTAPTSFDPPDERGSGFPDISIFMHSERRSWHNNAMLDNDALTIITHLSLPAVMRAGYFSLRCHLPWDGCAHLQPSKDLPYDEEKPEQDFIRDAWTQIWPNRTLPDELGAPCCSQFAISRDALLSVPLSEYERLRTWLIDTELVDQVSGRIFEWTWHVLWTGKDMHCPAIDACYCDGFGVCFGDGSGFAEGYNDYDVWTKRYDEWIDKAQELRNLLNEEARKPSSTDPVRGILLHDQVMALRKNLDDSKFKAWEVGKDPSIRAKVAGREWKEGDGF